jgi:hypothetical protein
MLVAGAGDLLKATFTRRNPIEVLGIRESPVDAIEEMIS